MAINLAPTDDTAKIKKIAAHADIWPRFSDGVAIEDYEPLNDERHQWFLIMNDNLEVGLIMVEQESNCSIGFHPYMLKPFRRYFRDVVKLFFKWFLDDVPASICKINVLIPECFKSTINAAKKTGFKQEGVMRSSYAFNGLIYDQIMSGITRKEVINVMAKH